MGTWRVEIMNKPMKDLPHKKFVGCKNDYLVCVFLIPGVEVPFAKLGLKHDYGNSG